MKSVIPLDESTPLPAQVASHLLAGRKEKPIDLGDTLVLVPTAGAGRSIKRELAKKGVLSPEFLSPMDALLPHGVPVASRLEREAAWTLLLAATKRQQFAALVPPIVPLANADDRFGVAARLCQVCDQLTEAGLHPASPELADKLSDDALRWDHFGKLYAEYLAVLAKHGLRDPNDVRLEQAGDASIPSGIHRVVVACVPDLAPVVETFLCGLSGRGVIVDILAWSPSGQAKHLDAAGRPDPNWWKKNPPAIADQTIITANDPASEAGMLLDRAAEKTSAGYALFSAAPESTVALDAEIARRGEETYLPEGKPLGQTEWAGILLGREKFLASESLRELRSLLQRPAFLRWFIAQADSDKFGQDDALRACDLLLAERLCQTVGAARCWLREAGEPADVEKAERATMTSFVRSAENFLHSKTTSREFLALVADVDGAAPSGSAQARELAAAAEALDQFDASALLSSLPADAQEAALRTDIHRKRVFSPSPDHAVEIQGWLEAPWSTADLKIIAGCREGALPSGLHEDAFLPDQSRQKLGLMCQDSRFARDAYLLSCLLGSDGHVLLGTSRFRSQGEPNRPSRLLFSCRDDELPERARKLLRPSLPAKRKESPRPWSLHVPPPDKKVESIRVTGFKTYLQCPLRFYLQNVRGLSDFDPAAREISASGFGTVIHKVLEEYGNDLATKDLDDAEKIVKALDRKLDDVSRRRFGSDIPPVVRVQLESMRARLHGFAPLQAEARADGWEIIATERAVKKTDTDPFTIGPLRLTGTMDRVEINSARGLIRVLDYKTFGTSRTPAQTHLAAKRVREDVPSASCSYQGKDMFWKDLQLPLYRHMVPRLWKEHSDKQVDVGYILLPADADDTSIAMLTLEDSEYESAMECAGEVATLVSRGIFWPPSEETDFDNFADWFRWCEPSEVIEEESRRLLGGAA